LNRHPEGCGFPEIHRSLVVTARIDVERPGNDPRTSRDRRKRFNLDVSPARNLAISLI
jgi:hypothetical protein